MTLEQLIAIFIGLLTLFGALWALRASDKKELANTDDDQDARIRQNEAAIRELRDELHTHYSRRDALAEMRREIRGEFAEMKAEAKRDFGLVFERLNDLAQQMARYQGRADRDRDRDGGSP